MNALTRTATADLTPDLRRRDALDGVPIRLADGNEWTIIHLPLETDLDAHRDRLYDCLVVGHDADEGHALGAWMARALLRVHYEITVEELDGLLTGVDEEMLVDAGLTALFGPQNGRVGWSAWATTALRTNGLDPGKVNGKDLPGVLDQLVLCGRAAPFGRGQAGRISGQSR